MLGFIRYCSPTEAPRDSQKVVAADGFKTVQKSLVVVDL
jgi:hypothetical protein